jgi:integrase
VNDQGIRKRHSRKCRSEDGWRCNCRPSFEASVWDARAGKRIRKAFPTLAAARSWRADTYRAIQRNELRAPSRVTVREACESWLEGAEAGRIHARGGPYKPSALRGYRQTLEAHVYPALGHMRLADVRRSDLMRLVEDLRGRGLSGSTIRNAIAPLRVVYGRAVDLGEVAVNPCAGLKLPAADGRRDGIPSPDDLVRFLGALAGPDRAIFATAAYAGLRAGELQALRWEDIDLPCGLIRVRRSYDSKARRFVAPKSKAGTRTVPMFGRLKAILAEHKLRAGRTAGLVFGRDGETPVDTRALARRVETACKRAGVSPYGLHACRHGAASLMIAAGVNAKALSNFIGHGSIQITFDRYGHLFPGAEDVARGLVDDYLERIPDARTDAQAV